MPTSTRRESGSVADLTLTDESALTKTAVRAADGTPAATALGLTFGAAERRGTALVARIRPDEWIVLGSREPVAALDLDGFASTVDITHSRLLFRLTGADAARALEKVCSLDFSEHMTPDGACTGASVAEVSCDVIRDDVDGERSYLVLCDGSYRRYLFAALLDATAEFD